ncbi:ATP-dependent zinc metalloprotease FTSH 11, chloroplastic/mitochondrial [Turnera subulata]|uniref:ATP-dependent zinc metalloprotease FTSH 11, chloroplastic/mitochondrial n=1 Tax=Turnera subulata TaxID=218843 RepID=A0A9Q0GJL2_9ROSI|nr:ATP-dependent zinc metalloprotease FTSH 11, chloroplastic/mitochondrial [Turnera subulata]
MATTTSATLSPLFCLKPKPIFPPNSRQSRTQTRSLDSPRVKTIASLQPRPRTRKPISLGDVGLLGAGLALTFVAPASAAAAAAGLPLLEQLSEPANALSLPTWAIHVSSVIEWITAMALVWQYGEKSGIHSWKGLAWGMVPLLGGAFCACTWHFFYNSESLEVLVALQAALTLRHRSLPPPSAFSSSSSSNLLRPLSAPCTLRPDNAIPDSFDSITPPPKLDESRPPVTNGPSPDPEPDGLRVGGELATEASGNPAVEKREGLDGSSSKALPVVVFLLGVWASIKRGFEKVLTSEWLSWWPFWRQEKRLERLIAEADANPKDPEKQSALLAELNKHSPESVIKRFEQREHAVDSKGVVEYLRALYVTNAINDYLPDEQTGKPSSLPALLQELKQRVSGDANEPFVNPGVSEKQPLHVVMVDPKVPNKSRFAQELFSTILLMGAAALQKYIASLGGIGTSGVGSSSSYAPKELNKEVMPEKNVKTFKDVKGCDDAKQELEEVVEYLKNPTKFTRLGGKLPKAIAGEAGVPFFYRAGSEFEEMFVGVGARRVRSLFQAAKKKAPCIIFIDEIDAVGSTRKQWEGHTKKTLHQLLVEMDGFEQNEQGIILMAATNLPDILDPALTRPGRFDRHIVVPNPDVKGRQEILELYLQDKPLADDVDVKAIARGTPGFNGADLANLVNIAAIKAAVEGAERLTAAQLEFAKDRIIMGTERKTMFISEESKKLTAYHESGHAIVALNTEGAHPIHKATIMPRGSALGMVTQLPSSDETSISKKQLLARLDVCMGGRVAEELIFGQDHVTTGASSDLHTATELAQYMVVKLLREAYDRVKTLLRKHEKALHALANALLEYETLSSEEIKRTILPYREGRLPEQQEEQEAELVLV